MEKRFYWIKLKESFITSDSVDFLMSQKNGANYVVLYQMLCLKTINTNGEFARQIGEIIIPYDIEKIQRDCKYFDIDTIRVALNLFKQLGLIYEQDNGILKIADFDNLIGSESKWAQYKRKDKIGNFPIDVQNNSNEIPIRDIDNRYVDNIYIDNIKETINIKESREKNKDLPPFDKGLASPKKEKHKYGQYKNVSLTEEEYAKLLDMTNGDKAIEYLSEYREYKGYKAKSDYLAIKKWVFDALKREEQEKQKLNKVNKFNENDRPVEIQKLDSQLQSIDDLNEIAKKWTK